MARTIAGELTLPDGTPLANATIHLTAKRTEATRILEDVSSSFTTSSSGAYSQDIELGYYAVSVSYAAVPGTQPRRWHLGDVWVEDGDPITLTALLAVNASVADPTDAALLALLADAQAARDGAVQSAADAADSASAAADSESAAQAAQQAAALSESSASSSASDAATSANAAAASESNAASSASDAADSASAAATSESNAAGSALSAADSASAASGSASAAQAAETGAIAARDAAQASESSAASSASAAASSASDAAGSAAAAATSESNAASSAAAAATSESNAASSASAASLAASAAASAASAAEASESNAASSASAAAASASNAATSETNAASSASAAATSESNAANSASAAATSAGAAEAAWSDFDTRYLGAKASDPSVDNSGNPLQVGALYWNIPADEMRTWNGAEWVSGEGLPHVANTYVRRNSENDAFEARTPQQVADELEPLLDLGPELQPEITGSATFVHSSNEISLVGIAPALELEIGDVIQVSGSTSNNNLYTVEIINNDNSIVVNYEHRNGAGPLSLADETANVTIKRIAKWYSAPLGLGQMWQSVTSQRAAGVIYTNTTGRTIFVEAGTDLSQTASNLALFVDDVNISHSTVGGIDNRITVSGIVPPGSIYRIERFSGKEIGWWRELR